MPVPTIKVYSADRTVQTIDNDNPLAVTLASGGGASNVTLSAGTSFIGTVGYDLLEITQTPTITAGAYTAGDALGGLLNFIDAARTAGGRGEIVKVTIVDDAKQSAPIDLVLFDQTFTATADNSPFDPSDADLQNCLGYVSVANTDYSEFNDNCAATKASGLQMPFSYDLAAGVTSLFGQMVIRVGDTYAATDDITVKITVRRYV